MREPALLLLGLLPLLILSQNELQDDPCPPKLDMVFVMDTSGSIELVYAEHVKWTMALAEILPIREDAVRLAVIQYASYPLTEFSLSTYSSVDNVRRHLQQITFQAGVTRTGYALRKAESELFREDKGARPNADKLIILFSDGLSIDDPIRISDTLRNEKNVTLLVVSVGSDGFATEMERIAGSHADTYGPRDLDRLKDDVIGRVEKSRICANGERLSSLTTTAPPSTTRLSTTPTSTTTTTTTSTTTPPTTTTKQIKREHKTAATFKPSTTHPVRAFAAVRPLPAPPVVRKPTIVNEQKVTVSPIRLLPNDKSNSRSAEKADKDKKSKDSSSEKVSLRRGYPSFRSIIASRESRRDSRDSRETTTTPRRAPVTRKISSGEISTKVTAKPWKNPSKLRLATVPDVTTLSTTTQTFDDLFTTKAHSNTIRSTERRTTRTTSATTTSKPRTTTTPREIRRRKSHNSLESSLESIRGKAFAVRNHLSDSSEGSCRVDVLLLVDSSGSVHSIYDTQKAFLASILEEIDVSTHNHRVGLIQFAGRHLQKTEWSFDEMQANEQLMKAFGRIRHFTGTTYIGAALHAARKMLEQKRAGVKTMVILLSDGYSFDDVEQSANEIRELDNIEVFAVSVSNANTPVLNQITGDEDRVFVGKQADVMREIIINKLRCAL